MSGLPGEFPQFVERNSGRVNGPNRSPLLLSPS